MKELLTEQEEEMLSRMMDAEENGLREAAEFYREIPIPKNLQGMVADTIAQHAQKERERGRRLRRKRRAAAAFRIVGALAAAVVLFMIPLNMNEAFARQMQGVPVLGIFAKVLTIRSYSYTEDYINVKVQVPEIAAVEDGDGAAAGETGTPGTGGMGAVDAEKLADVNAEILQIVEAYEADAKQRFEEYREAFFATGGTEEEWGGRTCDVEVDYAVTYQEGSRLSLILTTTESWAAVYAQRYYYNLDLQSGKPLTLEELLGANWKERCNECIIAEIERRSAEEEGLVYWGYGAGADDDFVDVEGFRTVGEQTDFYINENGNVVVCFDKYEIAPGYMGMQEFEITGME